MGNARRHTTTARRNAGNAGNVRRRTTSPSANDYSRQTATGYSRSRTLRGLDQYRRRRRRRRIKATAITAVLVLVVGTIAAFGFMVGSAAVQAKGMVSNGRDLASNIFDSDTEGTLESAQAFDNCVQKFAKRTDGVVWHAAEHLPVLGADMRAVADLASIASDLNGALVQPLSQTLVECPMNMLLDGGNINPDAVRQICGTLSESRTAVHSANQTLASIEEAHFDAINEAVSTIKGPMDTMSAVIDENEGLIQRLPDILGCNGPRYYLVVAQNNAEVRPTGGMPGTYIPVTIENGQISFLDGVGATSMRAFSERYDIPITQEERQIFSRNLSNIASDFNRTPDFSRVGEIMAQGWNMAWNEQVDGIVGMDVMMFQYLVELAADSITLEDGTVLSTSDIAQAILHDVCWQYMNEEDFMDAMDERDNEILGSALSVFRENIGSVDLEELAGVLQNGFSERRLQVWMANDAEEEAFDNLGATGTISQDETQPELGVYFFDYTFSKMDWYLRSNTEIGQAYTNADGETCYDVTTTVSNVITPEEAEEATSYITGESPAKLGKSDMITCIYLFAPYGGMLSNIHRDGGTWVSQYMVDEHAYGVGFEACMLNGQSVSFGVVHLLAGDTTTITYTVVVSDAAESALSLRQTPLIVHQD